MFLYVLLEGVGPESLYLTVNGRVSVVPCKMR